MSHGKKRSGGCERALGGGREAVGERPRAADGVRGPPGNGAGGGGGGRTSRRRAVFVSVPGEMTGRRTDKFREQRIDGSGLPLLTEEHLTGMLQMKLGPALKLRALLARKKAECPVCCPAKVNGTLKSEPRSNTTSPS